MSIEGEYLLLRPFYELGSLREALHNRERWARHERQIHWGTDGVLSSLSRGVASGMAFLHQFRDSETAAPIIHRGLKTDCVLVESTGLPGAEHLRWSARVSDFGVSKEHRDETMTQVCLCVCVFSHSLF